MYRGIFADAAISPEARALYDSVESDPETERALLRVDEHDISTGVHMRGVGELMGHFAVEVLGELDDAAKYTAVRVAALHDIGKIDTPGDILRKPGKPSEDEWALIKEHPVTGFRRYAELFSPQEALPVLLHHTFQENAYPGLGDYVTMMKEFGLGLDAADEQTMYVTAALAVADNIEARFPVHPISGPYQSTRTYAERNYSVQDLPLLVLASFTEAGYMRQQGLEPLLNQLTECSQDTLRTIA